MKAVVISIKPKYCELIASGKKTIEVRKSKPKLETPFKVYMYMTMNGVPKTVTQKDGKEVDISTAIPTIANGKVIGEFVCDKITKIGLFLDGRFPKLGYSLRLGQLKETCLSLNEIENYGKGKPLYAWHITDLKIYDKPKELEEFDARCTGKKMKCNKCNYLKQDDYYEPPYCESGGYKEITRPPQSWCYCEELEEV